MNQPSITDWLTAVGALVIPIALAIGPSLFSWITRPIIQLSTDSAVSGDSTYFRLKVENKGYRIAKKCIGRLIEIRNGQGENLSYPQLNFCWERHNQLNLPHPVDIPRIPKASFASYLDIAKYAVREPNVVKLRVDADNQQLPQGSYSEMRELSIPVGTYYLLVSVYTEDGYAETNWYDLNWSGEHYSIEKSKPPKRRG